VRYRIVFANGTVGQAQIAPVEIEIPDSGTVDITSELCRRLRGRIVDTLVAAPAAGAEAARSVLAANTNVVVMLNSGEGAAYYGTTTLGRFSIIPIS
jgi:hypothetical protein